jgi:hypothetical protein
MAGRSWECPLTEDSPIRVSLEPEDAGPNTVRYRIAFPFVVNESSASITGTGGIDQHELRSDSGIPVSDVTVSTPSDTQLERLFVRSSSRRIVLYLPSGRLLDACRQAVDGDQEAAATVIETFGAPVRIPLVCGSFLGVQDTIRLLETIGRTDRHAQSLLHSYRYAIARSAVVASSGWTVDTYRELAALVGGLDDIEEIGAVSLIETLADIMATVHGSMADTEQLLESFEFEIRELRKDEAGLFTSCYLAQLVVAEGIRAAEDYEPSVDLPQATDYERRKRGVLRAEYGQRGSAWRSLLIAAQQQSTDEFEYVLANALYWTAEESRSDSRMAELLYRGAQIVADDIGLTKVEILSRSKRHIAAGHRLRSAHCFEPSMQRFDAAWSLAIEYRYLDTWRPILSKGLVQSHLLSQRGQQREAIRILDETMELVLDADPPTEAANESVHHLEAQKQETRARIHRPEDAQAARGALREAGRHYDTIGFDRS